MATQERPPIIEGEYQLGKEPPRRFLIDVDHLEEWLKVGGKDVHIFSYPGFLIAHVQRYNPRTRKLDRDEEVLPGETKKIRLRGLKLIVSNHNVPLG